MKNCTLIVGLILTNCYALFAQRPCDTLITSDGVRIPAQIIRSKEGYIYYYKCEDFVKTEQLIVKTEVTGFLPAKKPVNDSITSGHKSLRSYFTQNNENEWHKNGYFATIGLALTDYLVGGVELEAESALQFGLQFKPEKSLFQVAIFARPLTYYGTSRLEEFKTHGINAEFTITIKRLTYGRFTGVIKNGYYGLEIQSGTRSYSYNKEQFGLGIRSLKTKATSRAVLARFGIQRTLGHFYVDFSMSIGPRMLRSQTTGGLNRESDSYDYISIQPLIGAGVHF
ncbi:MAG: hypothetical protein JNN28_13080 [Saprospiraceae bacterium]|nr:hypothetical protein [Saprospiraceae bacterium]